MSKSTVTYTRLQREKAKELGQRLICVDALGMTFSGPVPEVTARALLKWVTENIIEKKETMQ